MRLVPPLAGLAAVASLLDWGWARFGLRALSVWPEAGLGHQLLLRLGDGASVVRNLAAIAALFVLYQGLGGWIRQRPDVPLSLRVVVAGFAGVLLPMLLLSTILPAERTSMFIVLFATVSTNVLALTLDGVSLHWPAPRSTKLGVLLIAVASFFSFGAVTLAIVSELTLWEAAHPLGMAMRRTGEVAYLVALLVLPLSAQPWRAPRSRRAMAVAAVPVIGLVVAATMVIRQVEPEAAGPLVYGMTHLELLLGTLPGAYFPWLAGAIILAVGAIASPVNIHRQLGLGTLLLVAAGYAPTTPSTLLMWGIGAVLLSRAVAGQGLSRAST